MLFQHLSIANFRGFESLKVNGLKRVNLFLGRNNVGKTALIESVFLLAAPANPELPSRVHGFRGIDHFRNDAEDLWGWLFYGKDVTKTIRLELETDTHKKRSLKMRVLMPKRTTLRSGRERREKSTRVRRTTTSTTIAPSQLSLEYTLENGIKGEATARIAQGGVTFEHGSVPPQPQSVFVTARGSYSPENPERFSKLQELMEEDTLLPAMRVIEPRLKKLSVLASSMGPMIYGDIGIKRMVPIPMMGEGIGRLLTILLAVFDARDGMVMVDEIDTGFYHSILPAVWTSIAKAARQSDTQVLATTHSWECLKAAHESFLSPDSKYDLGIHRIDRFDEKTTSTTYDAEMTETALSSGLEMR